MVIIIKYKKITIYHAIYIKVFSDGTFSYISVSTDDVLNNTNNKTAFPEPRKVFEECFDIEVQEVSVLKYINFRFFSLLLVLVLIVLITSYK